MSSLTTAALLAAALLTGADDQPKGKPVDGNRLAYLDELNPYYPHRDFPKLVTPQWVGEEGVEAVVILGIDDMRGHEKYEQYLRPILDRLKQIDGRAPVSIMTCKIDPKEPHLQKWLAEGVSLECHTIDHPCPLLGKMNLKEAKSTYDRCVDQMFAIPSVGVPPLGGKKVGVPPLGGDKPAKAGTPTTNRPVAFRTPCCDSLNTVSPRFFAEIFNKTTEKGNFLTIDSSVFCLLTPNDPALPRELVLEKNGRDRFRKYLPADRTFVNYIEDYPYPYVIGNLCWEFPCMVPSDWAAQHLHQPNNPKTVEDWKAALDAVVIKQGVFCLVFHPHGWIRAEQVNQLIDYSQKKHGKKVKFLTFREAQERLNEHLLSGQSLRTADGQDGGMRLLDLYNDGYMDVVIGNDDVRQTRADGPPRNKTWLTAGFPVQLVKSLPNGRRVDAGVRFGVMARRGPGSNAYFLMRNEDVGEAYYFDGVTIGPFKLWWLQQPLLNGLTQDSRPVLTSQKGRDRGVRLRDLDGDGQCELIVGTDGERAVFHWSRDKRVWAKLPFTLPAGTMLVDADGRDRGLRFIDVDEDGDLDVLFSNESRYGLYLFESMEKGWSRKVLAGERAKGQNEIPMIVRGKTNNGAFFHSRHLWWQNEDTGRFKEKDLVDRRSFNELLKTVEPKPKSPEMSWRSIKTRPGFVVELVAAEPLVMDPVAFEWGPDGKLWVVEMADYPLGLDDKGKPGGRVKYLQDLDGDGKYDKATLFLEGLAFPTDVMPWRQGVLVTAAPDIVYAEDTDGDGRADVKKVLYTGFGEGNQQHRANGLRWGLDNWVYLANGDSAGSVKSTKTGKSVSLGARDLRIRPDEGLLDLQSGRTQHGRCRDDWGNWFAANNATPGWHYALADHYLRRNPHFAAPSARHELTANRFVYPRSRPISHWEGYRPPPAGQPGKITSACGHCVYRDELFWPKKSGHRHLFMSEVVHNLVHHMVLEPDRTTFAARRDVEERRSEFLASSDSWFRPTTLKTGPDGALWIADMYRLVIEHPQWIDDKTEKQLFLRAGHDKGRIYRVYPVGEKPRRIPWLEKLNTPDLVTALDSPNGWQRDMAQQMLLWRGDKAAVPLLAKLATASKRPLARLHALCALDGLNAVTREHLTKALSDPHPGIRQHAVRLCESLLRDAKASPVDENLAAALLDQRDATATPLKMQLAYTLGEWSDPRAGKALARIALASDDDPYLRAAVMSSAVPHVGPMLSTAMQHPTGDGWVDRLLELAVATKSHAAVAEAIKPLVAANSKVAPQVRFRRLGRFLDALSRRGLPLATYRREANAAVRETLGRLDGVLVEARRAAADEKLDADVRALAVGLLGRDPAHATKDAESLVSLLAPQHPLAVQQAAAGGVARMNDRDAAARMFTKWKSHSPAVRQAILDELLSRTRLVGVLLDQVEMRVVAPAELDADRRERLLNHRNGAIRKRAAQHFGKPTDASRQAVLAKYRPVVRAGGDAARGLVVYKKLCAKCHRLDNVGHVVGPDLTALTDRSAEAMLTAVLDPNRAVESKYQNYVAALADGRIFTGLLHEESGSSITLLAQEGKKHQIARANVEALQSTGKSLMPEGIEKDLSPRDLADVIAYVNQHSPRRKFPGNQPKRIKPAEDGSLQLRAADCEIYGESLVFEQKHRNLGYWSSARDHVIWRVELLRDGTYEVWLDWACANSHAGNAYVLQAGERKITGRVGGTGTWDDYRKQRIGRLTLPSGRGQIVLRPLGPIKRALIDLREVHLVPVPAR